MSLVVLEFCCPVHGRFESIEARATAPDSKPCECGIDSPWTISATAVKHQNGALAQGKVAAPNHPMALDTSDLGDGMPYNEWKKKRAAMWRDHDLKDPRRTDKVDRIAKVLNRPEGPTR